MCTDLYEHFHNALGEMSYYPHGSMQVSDNWNVPLQYTTSQQKSDTAEHAEGRWGCSCGFCDNGVGHGYQLCDPQHHLPPRSIDDFCQESVISTPRDREVAAVWRYLQNDKE